MPCADPLAEPPPDEARGRAELHFPMRVRDRLPGEQREAVALVMIEGLVYAGATALPDVPMSSLTSRLVRGRQALAALLGE